MVGAAPGRWDFAAGAGLVLPVREHRETHAAVREAAVVLQDAALARRRIVRVGMVRRLRAVDDVHPLGCHHVAARFLRGSLRRAAFAPDVALVDVVVVR